MIIIIDCGMGNLGSIRNMLKKIGAQSAISSDHDVIKRADKLILPGVGAFDRGMQNLNNSGIIHVLQRKVLMEGTPILGICLGMQLMSMSSEEGHEAGLGWIEARTKRFEESNQKSALRIPHMGWNYIKQKQSHPLLEDLHDQPRFYFVHSYLVECMKEENILTTTSYGEEFASSIVKENIVGTQFHPEKSHKFGLQIMKNFAERM